MARYYCAIWGSSVDRLRELESFVAVAEAGGFSRAALRLAVTPPAVTRAVASLEARLGVALFQRTTRRVRPTEAGSRFLEQARRLLADLADAEREVGGAAAAPTGHLSITAPVTFGRLHVAPVLAGLLHVHPRLSATLTGIDRVVDLVEEGHDAGVRIGDLPDSSLIVRRLGNVRRVVVGSPGYLATHGTPDTPAALKGHALVAFGGMAARVWRFQHAGRALAVDVAPRLQVNDAAAAIALAEAGEGLTLVLSYQAEAGLVAGRLRLVLEAFGPPPIPVHIVTPPSRLVAPKVRAFIDHAAPVLSARLAALSQQV